MIWKRKHFDAQMLLKTLKILWNMNIFISFKELLQLPSYPFIYKFLFMFCWISFPEAKGSIRLSRVHNLIYGFSYFLLLVVSSLVYVHWNIQSFFLSFVILLLLFAFYTYFRLHICSTSSKYNKKTVYIYRKLFRAW